MRHFTTFFIVCFVSGLALAVSAKTQPAQPIQPVSELLLTKNTNAGLVLDYMATSSQCEVYEDKVIITKNFAGVKVTETREIKLEDVADKIAASLRGKITQRIGPVDGPVAIYNAYRKNLRGDVDVVVLDSTGESLNEQNNAPEAKTLVLLLDNLCK